MTTRFTIVSAGKTGVEEQVEEITKTVPVTRVPKMYKVVLMNDDFTPMDFVVMILKTLFSKANAEAVDIMLQVHQQGYGIAGVYQYDIAETKLNQVHSESKAHGHPLRCRIEPE